jgi:hypothetical protein
MPTLYEISQSLEAIEELLFEVGGEVSDIHTEAVIDAWLGEYGQARDEKIDGYCALIREIEARRDARRLEAARLNDLATADHNAVTRLKERLMWFFEAHGIQKMDTARFRVSVANNGGVQPVAVLCKPEELPPQFQKIIVKADNDALREALEEGETMPFAALVERGRHLRIR